MVGSKVIFWTAIAYAICALGCSPSRHGVNLTETTMDNWRQFFARVESRKEIPTTWAAVSDEAKSSSIEEDISITDWIAILRLTKDYGFTSRAIIQLHPALKDRAFFDVMVGVLGYDSDLFTRGRVYAFMAERYPEDPATARFGLHLLLDAWSGKWPVGIDGHGNSPRETISLIVKRQWQLNATESITPAVCAHLLVHQGKWHFDRTSSKWTVQE